MRKLLLILLLLFPVHGAWAKKIKLECEITEAYDYMLNKYYPISESVKVFIIDTDLKIAQGDWPLTRFDDEMIEWRTALQVKDNPKFWYLKYNSIVRYTGQLFVYMSISMTYEDSRRYLREDESNKPKMGSNYEGSCKKITKKKF